MLTRLTICFLCILTICNISYFSKVKLVKIGFCMSKFDIRPEFECQNRILNVKVRYSARILMSKNEKRKTKSEKRKTKSKLTSPLIEYRKTKNEKQTNFTLLVISRFGFEGWIWVLIASVPDLRFFLLCVQ